MAILEQSVGRASGKREIDLGGPEGNAFSLMGTARSWARQIGYEKEDIDAMIERMKSSDYENLLKVFDEEFGDICDLVRSGDSDDEFDEEEDEYDED